MEKKLTSRQFLVLFSSAWAGIWIACLGGIAFAWHTLPPHKFRNLLATPVPLLLTVLICLPLATLLPIYMKARKEKGAR